MFGVDSSRVAESNLSRASVGIEHVEDLQADLQQAIERSLT